MNREEIINSYIKLSVEHQQIPSLIRFSNWIDTDLPSLREHFGSADDIQGAIWEKIIDRTYNALQQDADYAEYAIYEKLLAFHFTFVQIASDYRKFLELKLTKMGPINWESKDMNGIKQIFLRYVNQLSAQGQENGEIPKRMIGSEYLNRITWLQLLYILHFWARDESEMYGQTDAAIEKSTQWVFDILRRNVVDTSLDFGKFFFQNISLKNWIKW